MPELPEVETIKNELAPHVVGRRFTNISVSWKKLVKQPSLEEFRARLIGQKIKGLSRRGKYLIFHLNGGDLLIAHLKMSGALLVSPDSSAPPRYTNAILELDKGTIFFRDPRKFGAMWLTRDEKTAIPKLGPEPLEPDFTPDVLAERLKKHKAPIKAVLIDQGVIAGVGNMYADEALFAARIHPLRQSDSLSKGEIECLHHAIQGVLRAGIESKGASIVNYYRPSGELGAAHEGFMVAHRRGENCPRCGTPLQRIAVRNRGTYFCPNCQRLR